MRLIDADKAKEKLRGNAQKDGNPFVGAIVEMFCEFLDQAPTVEDVTPVVHGYDAARCPSLFECSVCGWRDSDTLTGDTSTYNFCPNCGAKMAEEEKHDPKG